MKIKDEARKINERMKFFSMLFYFFVLFSNKLFPSQAASDSVFFFISNIIDSHCLIRVLALIYEDAWSKPTASSSYALASVAILPTIGR